MGDISNLLLEAMSDAQNSVQLAIHNEVATKLGQVTAITIEQQMRAKGIRRAKATGTHKKRSRKEQAAADKYGSMLDVYYKIKRSRDQSTDIVSAGQLLTGAAYKARFRNDGWKNHHYWKPRGNGSGNDVGGEHYIEASQKILRREVPKLITSTASRVLSNPKKYTRRHRVGI